jgi:bis(5'-nucleosyl)-tetraphosphatase (symmetrical)
MRTITVGDIHGCLEEFDELLNKLQYKQGTDRLLLLGDLIDRGPDPAGVVRRAREIGAESLKGNHEEKALRWRKHEAKRKADPDHYKNPMRPLHEARLKQWAEISDDDWDWIASCPVFSRVDNGPDRPWVAVHAGCKPGVPMESQLPNELMRLRFINPTTMKMVAPTVEGEQPGESTHWTNLWKGPESVVYGHYTYFDGVAMAGSYETALTLGIDTGCVHGLQLTAATFQSEVYMIGYVQVQAKRVYAERKAWTDE